MAPPGWRVGDPAAEHGDGYSRLVAGEAYLVMGCGVYYGHLKKKTNRRERENENAVRW